MSNKTHRKQAAKERQEVYRVAVTKGDDPDIDFVHKKQKKRTKRDELVDLKYDIEMDEHKIKLEELVARLQTDTHMGLTPEKANEVMSVHGPNEISRPTSTPEWVRFVKQLFSGFSLLLWIGALLSFTAYSVTVHVWEHPPQDNLYLAIVLLAIVVVTACFSYYQRSKSEAILQSFRNLIPHFTTTLRSGEKVKLHSEELVVGDIIELRAGDKIPADVRIISAKDFLVDMASLTGEIEPVPMSELMDSEHPLEARNIAFVNTYCVQGSARAVVIQTGDRTLFGRIANLATNLDEGTPIAQELAYFMKIISVSGIALGITFAIMAVVLGYYWLDAVIFMVGVSIANVPEGLVATLTICLTLTAKRAASKNCLVKGLEAIESLSSCSYIVTNQSKVLTQGKFSVRRKWYDNMIVDADISDNQDHPDPDFDRQSPTWRTMAQAALFCNNAKFTSQGQQHYAIARECEGNPVDVALLRYIDQVSPGSEDFLQAHPRVCEVPFNSTDKIHVSINEVPNQQNPYYILAMKGSPESILERCSTVLVNGEETPLSEEWRDAVRKANEELCSWGEKVVGFCDYYLPPDEYPPGYPFEEESENFPMNGLRFIGLMSMLDPPRPAVPDAVLKAKTAGIKVIMVTGEHPTTAKTIAKAVGIISQNSETVEDISQRRGVPVTEVNPRDAKAIVVQGSNLREMTPQQLDDIMFNFSEVIFARTAPQQKLTIVESCQRLGGVVAVTGDSVQDVAAMRTADLAIAMGMAGTDIAKESSDMILLDDNFASIVSGIEEGRLIFDNLKKSIAYTLTSNIPEIAPFILFILGNVPLPLGTITIICIDFGTDIVPAISLAYEQPEHDLMRRPPRDPINDSLVNHRLIGMAYGQIGMIQAVGGFFMYFIIMAENGFWPERLIGIRDVWDSNAVNDLTDSYGQEWAYSQRKVLEYTAHTGFFVAVVIMQWADLVICKTRRLSIFQQGMMNHHLTFALFFETGLAIFLVYCPGFERGLRLYPLLFVWWFAPLEWALVIVIYDEIRKLLIRYWPQMWLSKETYY